MAEETIFTKIIKGEIPSETVYKDEDITAFRDIDPKAPTHILVVPNKVIPTVNDISEDDQKLMGKLFTVAAKIAHQEGIAESGYRLIINCNSDGGQEVFHLHMHILGGNPMGPMVSK